MGFFNKQEQKKDIDDKQKEMHNDDIDKIVSDSSDLIKKEETKRSYEKSLNKVQNGNLDSGTVADIENQKDVKTTEKVDKIQENEDYKIKKENDSYELKQMEESYKNQQKLTDKAFNMGLSLIKSSAKKN
jgi:hypothetical protein